MPIPQRYNALISSLFTLTVKEKLEWQSLGGGGVLTTVGTESIRVSPINSMTGGGRKRIGLAVSLHNDAGEAVDSFQVRDTEEPEYRLISELYDLGRRAALGVEEIIRRVEAELQRLAQNGEDDSATAVEPTQE